MNRYFRLIRKVKYIPAWLDIPHRWRRFYWRRKLKYLGKNVRIDKDVTIRDPGSVSIGDNSWIEMHSIIEGGRGVEIGRYVHVGYFCILQGGGTIKLGDYAGIAPRVTIYSEISHYSGRTDTLPPEQQVFKGAPIIIEKDVFVYANSMVFPGVTIGEGAIIGANSLVNKDVPPWKIFVGSPAHEIGERPKLNLPDP